MSCWRKFTCDILKDVSRETLHRACRELGYDFDESIKKTAQSWESREADVDAGLVKDGMPLSLGFCFNGDGNGHLTVEGDFWGTGIDEADFVDRLSQQYTKLSLLDQLVVYGFGIESVVTNERNEIVIEACCA